jgi:hypothetical protein
VFAFGWREQVFRVTRSGRCLYCAALADDPIVQRFRTPPFHGGNTGSNPVRVATFFDRLSKWLGSSDTFLTIGGTRCARIVLVAVRIKPGRGADAHGCSMSTVKSLMPSVAVIGAQKVAN